MLIPQIAKGPELVELIAADPEYADRHDQCLRDIEACGSVAALKRCQSAANLGRGYRQEWTSHHGMVQRAGRNGTPLSDALRSFPAFLAHVGPKPHYETVGKLSLDKTNSKGYVVGSIRWLHPEGQTRNRSNTKFHLYKGRYYTDKELAVLLTALSGKLINADAVKKRRQRDKTTVEQFEAAGVPYESGLDPLSEWDFPPAYVNSMAVLFRSHHYKGETRIAFFVRWLRSKELPRFESLLLDPAATADQRDDLQSLAKQYGQALSIAELERRDLKREAISKEIVTSVYQPLSPASMTVSEPNSTYFVDDEPQETSALPAPAIPVPVAAIGMAFDQLVPGDADASAAVAEVGNECANTEGHAAPPAPAGHDAASILDPVHHAPLIAGLAGTCETANVLPEFVRRSSKPFLTAPEQEWLLSYQEHRKAGRGLVLTGKLDIPPEIKFQAMAGVLLRNFIDARVISVQTLILDKDRDLNPTVMLIPNLFTLGNGLRSWHQQLLYDLLITRRGASKLTVAYVEDMAKLKQAFGWLFALHLTDGYQILPAGSAS